ncbi:MAG: dodecin domain-containing protein [Rhodobacteraceae bacterium]|nr:dodecin domain-containing protein [Paracoccaceae bacterium]
MASKCQQPIALSSPPRGGCPAIGKQSTAGSLRDLRVAEVTKLDMKVESGKVAAFRTRVSLSFKYEA